jgi:hypothetical protein
MSKRLQVLLDDAELRELRRVARARRMTVAAWVRQTLRDGRRREPVIDTGQKLMAIRRAAAHAFPTADIDEMLSDIERGYAGNSTR